MAESEIRKALDGYTVRELRILAELAGIPGRSELTKPKLIDTLIERGYRLSATDAAGPGARKADLKRILAVIEKVSLGPSQIAGRLTVVPVEADDFGSGATPLFEEIDAGTVHVEEAQEGGSVPELRVKKASTGRTLFLEGEPLIGGKQDRILNTTFVIDGPKDTIVPVSCIERGRWSYSSERFSSSSYHSYYSSRSYLSRSLSSSLRSSSGYLSDQPGVWRDIAFSLSASGTTSRTDRMADLFEKHKDELKDYQEKMPVHARQLGYLATIDNVPVALELFSSHQTFEKYWPRLLNGLAMETLVSLNIRSKGAQSNIPGKAFINKTLSEAVLESYSSVGDGRDIRITGRHHRGSALVHEGQVQHLVLHWR